MALVLGRKPGEKVIIEHNEELCEIEVVKSPEGHLRLKLTGDKSFNFYREEVFYDNDSIK
ncbi:carbon storage regulator [Halobacillus sp. Nhm2S1]|uniref:carbon storage regulator n=1 Tax=Halobacillus sp. Nhm2S1 TaxID=2866716 RepID=UPI001C72F3B6|nr:carbon storage regulator [Halobacillus sp. Nhm2S1]MBX0358909.1 carbon storage regulator [Halobacillus sp. Nhm2S1]